MWGRQSESLQSLSYSRNRDGPRKEDIHLRDCRNTSKSKPSEELPLPKFWCKNPGSFWFLFLSSLRLPQQLMADLLHTWGINIPLWTICIIW